MSAVSKHGSGTEGGAAPEAALVTNANKAALMAHYERYFGAASHLMISEKISQGVHLEIYLFPPSEERPFITAATVGMSALPLKESQICENCAAEHSEHRHYAELIMYLDPDWDFDDLIAKYSLIMMTCAARAPHMDEFGFGSGMTFEFPLEIVPEGSLLTNGYVMRPVFELLDGGLDKDEFDAFASVELPDGISCDLYWLVPITTAECYLKRTRGRGALLELLMENRYFCLDIDRKCYVESENRHQRRAREKAQRARAKRRPHTSVYELTCEACGHGHDEPA